MNLTFSSPLVLTEQICKKINPNRLQEVELKAQKIMPNSIAEYNYIINSIALDTVTSWLKNCLAENDDSVIIPESEMLESYWSVVSGTPVSVDNLKLVIIPNDTIDISGISIAREWLEIPHWTPDYFLAVQVNLEEKWVLLWGYIHSNTVKQKGNLNQSYQYYTVSSDLMSFDLELLGVTQQFINLPQYNLTPIKPISESLQNECIDRLSQPSPFSPRLELPFETWSRLISFPNWCKKLHKQRCVNSSSNQQTNKLLDWLKNQMLEDVNSGWQDLNQLISMKLMKPAQFSFVRHCESHKFQEQKITKAKIIDLQVQLNQSVKIILLIAITEKAENKFSIVAQLHPDKTQKFLPESLKLGLISNSELLHEVNSRSHDQIIQTGLTVGKDHSFQIKITFRDNIYFQEIFML